MAESKEKVVSYRGGTYYCVINCKSNARMSIDPKTREKAQDIGDQHQTKETCPLTTLLSFAVPTLVDCPNLPSLLQGKRKTPTSPTCENVCNVLDEVPTEDPVPEPDATEELRKKVVALKEELRLVTQSEQVLAASLKSERQMLRNLIMQVDRLKVKCKKKDEELITMGTKLSEAGDGKLQELL
ncbi:hypothetical protein CAPTEDRAFT_202727 [Capitella teleta]|uniref:Uncharacterized protein n=1 Tax=Capitella teleta TaxID=283909 RepID=R7UMG1_CAPTE|nr:hypothetical protein CAPTEDRAFT_202727 [Capitella teleta]|eukprot:ELU07420.1 hypothetical protein CAPTEDRAFT_202727 [Capitella teleta]